LALVMASTFVGCASTYKDFKPENVRADEGVAIGRVHVVYNGRPFTKDCSICFNSVNGPCQTLTPEGLVCQNLKKGTVSLRRVLCRDGANQHHAIKDATFELTEPVVYFGDVEIKWTNRGGYKPSAIFGLVGALADQATDDGDITISVDDDGAAAVAAAFAAAVGEDAATVGTFRSIVAVE